MSDKPVMSESRVVSRLSFSEAKSLAALLLAGLLLILVIGDSGNRAPDRAEVVRVVL